MKRVFLRRESRDPHLMRYVKKMLAMKNQDETQSAAKDGLNEMQRQAVEATDGPVLVLAGAGTGKTRVLTTRLAHILQSRKASPQEILAVTFTNKAAQEMKERVSAQLGGAPVEGWWLGTFHALAARMLRRHADLVGLTSQFTIIDTDDQIRLLKQLMEAANLDTKKWPPKQLIHHISRWKDRGLRPQDVKAQDHGDSDVAGGQLLQLYHRYQDRLREVNACDFGDLLLHVLTIFKDPANADILNEYHARFRYILVDEYQDTNVAQYMWLRLLAKGTGRSTNAQSPNICCVGDDDQSIYGWRGAEVGNILRFEQDFPGALVVKLEQNYRSTGHILGAASGVIAQNSDRLGKTLWSEDEAGEKVSIRGLWDGEAEARWVGEEIEQLQHKGWRLNQMAVLVRAGFQTREFEERFIQLGLPYRVIGGQRFYERLEIRDALAYLRVISQPADDLALERIINTPRRGIGDATLQTLYGFARAQRISLTQAIGELGDTDEITNRARNALTKLMDDFNRWRAAADTMPHTELASLVLEESGYLRMWQEDKSAEAPGRIENLKELITGLAEFDSLTSFLEHVALVLDTQDNQQGDHVTLMTLHAAKGLEFDAVFLPGWEEGLFPSQKTMDEHGLRGLEEERRLAYVGITRARKRAFISYVSNRRIFGNYTSALPARFLDELPEQHVSKSLDPGLYGTGRSSHWDSSGITPQRQQRRERQAIGHGASQSGGGFQRGQRVFHDKFGYGAVVHVDGKKLDIKFDHGGMKRVMDSFIKRAEDV